MVIVVGASKPKACKIGAKAIMWWEETPASHVYMKLKVTPTDYVVFQAVGSGVEFCGAGYFYDHAIPVYEKEIEVSKETSDKIISMAIQKLKTKYSRTHLLGLFYKRFVQYVFKKIVKNPFKDGEKSDVCVELLCSFVDVMEVVKKIEDPEDMGMFEALAMLKTLPGKGL